MHISGTYCSSKSVTMPPDDRYLENVLPDLLQGIKTLEGGVHILYPQKELLQLKNQKVIFGIPYETPLPIQKAVSGLVVNLNGYIPVAVVEHSNINPNQPTDIDYDKTFQGLFASGVRSALELLSDLVVRLSAVAQWVQYSPHLQEHALDVRKHEVTDPQGHHSEVSQSSKISQMNACQLVGSTDQVSHWFLLSKAEILGMKWLEMVNRVPVKSQMTDTLTIIAELKPVLIEYTVMIDQILVAYAKPANEEQSFPEKGKVMAINQKLQEIISQLNPKDIRKIFPETIVVTEEDFLCALLGLNSEVANHLKSMPEEFRQHEPDDYYIKNFIEENIDCTENGSEGDLNKCFEECGFTSARAVTLAKRHKKGTHKNHQSLSLWLERYVDDIFRYIVRLGGDSPRYPFNEKVTDKLVPVELTRYAEDDDGFPQETNFNVNVLNSPTLETEEKYQDLDPSNDQMYWYHGTDHASVISILEGGIQTRRGRAMQDFSDDDGFYLSSNFNEAKIWAFSRNRPAVIIFKKSELTHKFKGMNLNNHNEAQWAQIVKYNRCGRSRKCLPENDLRTTFHESDFVSGPRSIDGRKGTPENENYLAWQPSGYQEGHQQLCIRSDEMAETFGKVDNIESVVFY